MSGDLSGSLVDGKFNTIWVDITATFMRGLTAGHIEYSDSVGGFSLVMVLDVEATLSGGNKCIPKRICFQQVRTFASDINEFLLDWLPSFPPKLLPPPFPPIAPNWIAEKLAIEEAMSNA